MVKNSLYTFLRFFGNSELFMTILVKKIFLTKVFEILSKFEFKILKP